MEDPQELHLEVILFLVQLLLLEVGVVLVQLLVQQPLADLVVVLGMELRKGVLLDLEIQHKVRPEVLVRMVFLFLHEVVVVVALDKQDIQQLANRQEVEVEMVLLLP